MREVIANRLWIGNAAEARQIRPVMDLDVRAVIDVAMNEPPVHFPREITYCRFPLTDSGENDEIVLRAAITTLRDFINGQTPTFAYCSAGMSRSVAIVAAGLSLALRIDADEALERIALCGPHDVSPTLWSEVSRIANSLRQQAPN